MGYFFILHRKQEDLEQTEIDRPFIYMIESYLYEVVEDRDKAIAATQQFQKLKPSSIFKKRLEQLKTTTYILNPESAKAQLKKRFHPRGEVKCEHDEHHHEHDHEHEE